MIFDRKLCKRPELDLLCKILLFWSWCTTDRRWSGSCVVGTRACASCAAWCVMCVYMCARSGRRIFFRTDLRANWKILLEVLWFSFDVIRCQKMTFAIFFLKSLFAWCRRPSSCLECPQDHALCDQVTVWRSAWRSVQTRCLDWRKSLCFLAFSKIMTIFADDLESPDCSKALRSRIAIPDASRFRSKTWSFVLSMIASLLFVSKKVASSCFVLRDSSYICSALENPVHSVFSHTDKVCFPHRQKRDRNSSWSRFVLSALSRSLVCQCFRCDLDCVSACFRAFYLPFGSWRSGEWCRIVPAVSVSGSSILLSCCCLFRTGSWRRADRWLLPSCCVLLTDSCMILTLLRFCCARSLNRCASVRPFWKIASAVNDPALCKIRLCCASVRLDLTAWTMKTRCFIVQVVCWSCCLLSSDFMILRPSDVPDLLSMKIRFCLKCCCHWIKIFWRSAVFPAAFLRLLIASWSRTDLLWYFQTGRCFDRVWILRSWSAVSASLLRFWTSSVWRSAVLDPADLWRSCVRSSSFWLLQSFCSGLIVCWSGTAVFCSVLVPLCSCWSCCDHWKTVRFVLLLLTDNWQIQTGSSFLLIVCCCIWSSVKIASGRAALCELCKIQIVDRCCRFQMLTVASGSLLSESKLPDPICLMQSGSGRKMKESISVKALLSCSLFRLFLLRIRSNNDTDDVTVSHR